MAIAGGEPLLYPDIVEVVHFISSHKMKAMLLTNGEKLTLELAGELKRAGLAKFHFHVDSGMRRPGWVGKNEAEMNDLRQRFADLVWDLGGVQCGYNITVFPSTLKYLPDIVEWCRKNIHKVQHVSLVAFRSIPLADNIDYWVGNRRVDPRKFQHATSDLTEIGLTTDEMFEPLEKHFPEFEPAAYLSGTAAVDSYKFLVTIQVGSRKALYGCLGAKTVEVVQAFHHLMKGRYLEFLKNPAPGRKLFFLSAFDRELRRTFRNFLKASLRNPLRFFDRIYSQSISLQQPNELLAGEVNLCDGCMNMMIYKGSLVHSCRLDEYRLFGGPLMASLREETVDFGRLLEQKIDGEKPH
jgi:hypothetical protein